MRKNSNRKKLNLFIVVVIILVLAIIALLVYNITTRKSSNTEKTVIDTATGQVVSGEQLKIYSMEESERIKYYFNVYIGYLENKEYEKAYNMLDEKFKNNYFKTLDSYTQYINKKYSPIISVTYDDLLRMGNYYILDVTFLDLFSSTGENMVGNPQKFVIYETDYNEYKMSFQAE